MAEIVWTDPAQLDLAEICEYIAFDDPDAADRLADRVVAHISQLRDHPRSGSIMPEQPRRGIRQIVEPPCRVLYRFDGETVFIVHIMRSEMMLRMSRLED